MENLMDVIVDGKTEKRKVVSVEMVDVGDGMLLPGIQTPETFDGEVIFHSLDGTHIVKINQ